VEGFGAAGRPEDPGPEAGALPEGVAEAVPGDVPDPDGAGTPVQETEAITAAVTAIVAADLSTVPATEFL
jgi:hypothetical protein